MEKAAISFLDILGFKGIWKSRPTEEILQLFEGVRNKIEKIYKEPPPEKKWPAIRPPEITILSDTIVVAFKSDHPQSIFLLANVIYGLQTYFLEANLFVRGAVSWGEYSQKNSTFIGPAIDDVASWYEATNFIGTVLTPKTNYLMDRFSKIEIGVSGAQVAPFLKYDVPDKFGGKSNLYCVNWPSYLQASYKRIPHSIKESDVRLLMYQKFSEQPAIDNPVFKKYENTLHFIDFSIDDFIKRNANHRLHTEAETARLR